MTPRILIIDDDDFTAIYLEGVIGELYQVEHCAVAEQGVAAAIANPPALILMDVEMPGMNGYAACRLPAAEGRRGNPRGAADIPVGAGRN